MLASFVTAFVLMAGPQSDGDVRTRAEQLARAGRTVEAIELFKQVVAKNPNDTEARLWVARLDLRIGNVDDAEATCRAVLREHPADVDAKIGLANALMRKGTSAEALTILLAAEHDAGENADYFAALARAYRRTGDDRRALEYFSRATALSPDDPDVALGYEALVLAYGHTIAIDGFLERDSNGSNTASGSFAASVRATPRLHVEGSLHLERRSDSSDALGGGGILLRLGRASTLDVRALGGSGNRVLATSDIFASFINYAGAFELGGGVRRVRFEGVDVLSFSPAFAWDVGEWRLDTRYSYSRLQFETHNHHYHDARLGAAATDDSTGDHSVFLRETWRRWRRASLNVAYAYGIESFEDLTVDRIGSLGATTLAVGARFNLPSLTTFNANWDHQWRSNSTSINRFTFGIVQSFP